ncbi:MAG: hypothetical protein Q8909_20865, partial [Bacteroidota bacterium]|nr:hypothetical protein [Bacteroidota bacterium]
MIAWKLDKNLTLSDSGTIIPTVDMKKPNTNEEAWALFSKVIIAQIIIDLIGFFSGWFTDYSTFLFPFQIP